MGTLAVVVLGVLIKNNPQVLFAEDEQPVQRSCRRVLMPRSQWAGYRLVKVFGPERNGLKPLKHRQPLMRNADLDQWNDRNLRAQGDSNFLI